MLKIYYIDRTDTAFLNLEDSDFDSWLDSGEQTLIRGYQSGDMKQEKRLGLWMIKSLLSRLYGYGPEDYRIEKGKHGKPYLAGVMSPLFFNLSHSGDYIVCVLSDSEVGIDIEQHKECRMRVAYRFFHPKEVSFLEKMAGKEQDSLFYRYWAAKESFLKYTGTGLAGSLSSFWVDFNSEKSSVVQTGEKEVYMNECCIDDQYACFVCSGKEEIPEIIRLSEWSPFKK